jgi:hypothetical protein
MRKRAQSISEYVVLITVVATAITVMQLYFRRSIQAAVKIAADQVGSQQEGSAEYDAASKWFEKESSDLIATSSGTETEDKLSQGSRRYGVDMTNRQEGGITLGITRERE